MKDLLITGGTIVNRGRSFRGYVLVKNGRIARVAVGDPEDEFRSWGGQDGEADGTASAVLPPFADPRQPSADKRATVGELASLGCEAQAAGRGEKTVCLPGIGVGRAGRSPRPGEAGGGGRFRSEEFRGERIDARGRIVMPGAIDAHVHLRQPGLTHKGDIHSETIAAIAGGVTSVMDMPNTIPATTSLDELERKFGLGAAHSLANYSFYIGATRDNLAELRRIDLRTVCGIKVFLGSSTGDMLVDDQRALAAIFAECGGVIAAHCEDEALVRAAAERYRRDAGDNATAAIHPLVRDAEACYCSTARAVALADRYGARLHVLHLSTARELALFSDNHLPGKKITAEACIGHLWFSDADYPRLGNLIKVNPAIKSAADRAALRQGLISGRIDTVATDHAPHTLEEKGRPYWQAPSGAPMVQHSLPAMMELVRQGVFPVEMAVEKMCHAPAVRYGVKERGFLDEGMWADIVVLDLSRPTWVRREDVLYKCGWSPLEGAKLGCSVDYTIVNGVVVNRMGEIDRGFRGARLEFAR